MGFISCKMQDLISDLAQHVAEKEMYIMSNSQDELDEGVHHASVLGGQCVGNAFLGNTNILSYLHVGYNENQLCNVDKSSLELLFANCRRLKALDLSGIIFESLPDSIGELLPLRYLNLAGNTKIEVLPKTITKLQNLQTLNLQKCINLKALPEDLSRLVNLRLLNLRSCSSLTCMPRGIGKLVFLHKLSDFMLGDKGNSSNWENLFDALEDLKPLDNLQHHLNLEIRCPNVKSVATEIASRQGLYPLKDKQRLKAIEFNFKQAKIDGVQVIQEQTRLMKELQPHPNLKYIKVRGYHGVKMDWEAFPSNLVELVMIGCWELKCFPCLGNLRHLKVLQLLNLKKLEYIIVQDSALASSSLMPKSQLSFKGLSSYYPSLETLRLESLPLLKGWRNYVVDDGRSSNSSDNEAQWQLLPSFTQLNSLFIWNCPVLICIPCCPTVEVEELKLVNFNRRLCIMKSIVRGENLVGVASSSNSSIGMARLTNVVLSNIAWLTSQPKEAFHGLGTLEIWNDKQVESLREAEEVFRSCSSFLRVLIIHNCSNLTSVTSGGLKHLTPLEKLEFRNCDSLKLSDEDEDQESGEIEGEGSIGIGLMTWSSNLHSLRTLTLQGLPELANLPNWMQFLPALVNLGISSCCQLKSLPHWMTKLTSLRHLSISSCSASHEKRCKSDPPGEDRPYIQHIPDSDIRFRNNVFQGCAIFGADSNYLS